MVSTRLVSSLSLEYARPMLSRASQKKGPARSCSPALPGIGGGEGDRTGVAEGGGGVAGGGEVAPPYSLPPAARGAASMSTAAFHISNLLEKMTSSDKDFRCALRRPGASFQGPQPVLVPPPTLRQTPAGTSWACLGLLPCFNSPAPKLFPPLLCWALRSPHTRRPPGPLMKSPIGLFLVSQCRPSLTRIQTGPFPAPPLS